MSEGNGYSPEASREFSLGIQMEEARRRMGIEVLGIRRAMEITEKIGVEDIQRWRNDFSRIRSFMEYEEDGEQAEYLRFAGFDLDAYNRTCEEIEKAFADWEQQGNENESERRERTILSLFENLLEILKKRFVEGARL